MGRVCFPLADILYDIFCAYTTGMNISSWQNALISGRISLIAGFKILKVKNFLEVSISVVKGLLYQMHRRINFSVLHLISKGALHVITAYCT